VNGGETDEVVWAPGNLFAQALTVFAELGFVPAVELLLAGSIGIAGDAWDEDD
jgi:hypothetical protein